MDILNFVTDENCNEWLEELKRTNETQGMNVQVNYGTVEVFNINTLAHEKKKGYTITIKQQKETI